MDTIGKGQSSNVVLAEKMEKSINLFQLKEKKHKVAIKVIKKTQLELEDSNATCLKNEIRV